MIEVHPETFTLVDFDSAEVRRLVGQAAARVGVDEVELSIDEELPAPITASSVAVVQQRGSIWMAGGNLEDPRYPKELHVDIATVELTVAMLRVRDRLDTGFADAPPDEGLADRERAAWDTWAYGRCARLGLPVRVQRSRYAMRLYHGFTDVTDAAFERLWETDELTWADLVAIGEETAAVDPRPTTKARTPVRRPNLREPAR